MDFPHDLQRSQSTGVEPLHTTLTTAPILCIECLRPWLTESERWRLKVTDDSTPTTVPYCPDCAAREFGER